MVITNNIFLKLIKLIGFNLVTIDTYVIASVIRYIADMNNSTMGYGYTHTYRR